jgi:hypothetical protein
MSISPNSFSFTWSEIGYSYVDAGFDLDVDAYGFKGWVGHAAKYVMLKIFQESIDLTQPESTTFTFQIKQSALSADYGVPVLNLTPESLKIWAYLNGTRDKMVSATVTALEYLGDGNYTATFSPRINEGTLGMRLTVTTPEDNIIVSTYCYRNVFVTLQSLEEDHDSENLGQIQLADAIYSPPYSMRMDPGTYLLRYFPEEGCSFLNWATSGFITVGNSSSSITSVAVAGNGTVTALYRNSSALEPPKQVNLALNSRWNSSIADSTSIFPTADSWVRKNNPTTNYGTDSTLHVKVELPDLRRTYFKFSLSVLPPGAVINSAAMHVYWRTGDNLPSVHFITDDSWTENGITWNNAPSPGAWVADGELESSNWYKWSVGSYVASEFAGDKVLSLVMMFKNESGSLQHFDFRSREVSDPNQRPWLEIFYSVSSQPDQPNNLGNITLGTNTYTLPNATVVTGDQLLQYAPHNSSYVFMWWETSGEVIPASSIGNPTTLIVCGNGSGIVTAVYGSGPPATQQVSVNLQSREETDSAPPNLGKIQFGETLYVLPNVASVLNGTYLLKYIPAEGYTFLNWMVTGDIYANDPYANVTSLTINGNGNVTAFYRITAPEPGPESNLSLLSREWTDSSSNIGEIVIGVTSYSLPQEMELNAGDYQLRYVPPNSSYVFLWWETSGNVIPWNSTSDTTTLTIYGNGTVTAVYALTSEPLPPLIADWSTLYIDRDYEIVPPLAWSGSNGHLSSWASVGEGKQEAILTSPATPTLYPSRYVNVTAYVRVNPPSSAKDLTLELGFDYDNEPYKLGNGTFTVNDEGVYRLTIDILDGEFPEGYFGVIPEGSVITITCTVTFFEPPWGNFFLYYGPDKPSQVELF